MVLLRNHPPPEIENTMNKLDKLLKDVTEDGTVDADEVRRMRKELFADGLIETEEVEFLFAVNDVVSGNDNDPGWKILFVEAISSHILADGTIDQEEVSLLTCKIQGDGEVDEVERALLLNLKSQVKEFPSELEALLNG
jgi:hypothetical protein